MPRYYFALDDDMPPSEQDGEELASDVAATQRALEIAADFGRNKPQPPRVAVFKRIT
jgi:hypothetical protein